MFYDKGYPVKSIGDVVDRKIARVAKVFSKTDEIQYLDISSIDNASKTVTGLTPYTLMDAPSRAQYVLAKDDIVYSTVRPNLQNIAINPYEEENVVGSTGFCVLRCTGVSTGYMWGVVNSTLFTDTMINKASGANYPAVTDKVVLAYEIPIPPEDQQLAYEHLVRQSDKSKFVRFKSQFIEMFGELDKNTKQFPVRKLNEISSYWNGLTYKPADAVKDGTRTLVLRSSNIQNGELAFEDNVYVNCEIKEKLFVQDNDILMCSRNGSAALVGKTALIKELVEPTTFGAFMMIIRSEYYSYLRTYFETPFFRSQISTGTSTINQITGKMLNDISLPVPDMDTVRKFESFVHQSDKSK